MFGKWLSRIKSAWSWARFAWQLAVFLGITGLISSVGGTVWAVIQGVPLPIALMVGYCTLVGAVCLGMAPLAYRALAQSPANTSPKSRKPPNYRACRLASDYSLKDAAHLWCDTDPLEKGTSDIVAWFKVLKEKVQNGTLELNSGWPASDERMRYAERLDAEPSVRVTRASLQAFAKEIGEDPRFLRDKD
jgi:hypothetical protein